MRLYHYTCGHVAKRVTRRGFLKPTPQPTIGGIPLLWLTDMDPPVRDALGLTSISLQCDRMDYRYIVDTEDAVSWPVAAERFVRIRARLETQDGVRPERWFVATRPVFAIQDRAYVNPQPIGKA